MPIDRLTYVDSIPDNPDIPRHSDVLGEWVYALYRFLLHKEKLKQIDVVGLEPIDTSFHDVRWKTEEVLLIYLKPGEIVGLHVADTDLEESLFFRG